jgi:O-antigen biosynthesis protein
VSDPNDRLRSEIDRLSDRIEQLEEANERLRERYRKLRERRVVRVGLGLAGLLARAKRRFGRSGRAGDGAGVPAMSREELVAAILEARTTTYAESGPLVRIVVPTRDGYEHLTRLFAGLAQATRYRSFEVVVVDNASTDRSTELYEKSWGFPLSVVQNSTNVSFSEACNQGAADPAAKYLLFLNNDIEPITPDWLGALVAALESDLQATAAASLLVYPESGRAPFGIQHRGIGFKHKEGVPLPYNMGGDDPLGPEHALTRPVAAATAACLMIRTADFVDLGGFDEEYIYGLEDVDLCMRLQEKGRSILFVGESALFHQEPATQDQRERKSLMARRRGNRIRFVERWSPSVSRNIALESIGEGERMWAPHLQRKVAITLTEDKQSAGWGDWYTAHELGDALEVEGWQVVYAEAKEDLWYDLPEDVALVISLLDRYDVSKAPPDAVTVAWVRNWTERWIGRPWFSRYDVVLGSSEISAEMLLEGGAPSAPIVPLATNTARFYPRPPDVSYACDYTFTGNHWGVARSIIEDLQVKAGESFTIYGKGWDQEPSAARYWRGWLPYEQLPELYSSAKIVLDDTAGPTLPHGAVNSRVFDALACGALVVSNNKVGSEELFDGLLPAYDDPKELRGLLDRYLRDEAARRETADRLRDLVLERHTYTHRAGQFVSIVRDILERPKIAIEIGPPDLETAETWGDTHFAHSFAKSLRRLGWRTSIDILPEWDQLDRQDADVVVHVRGLRPYTPKPAHTNVLWIISHPDDVTAEECERYDVVFVASEPFARELEQQVRVPVHVLLQATDTDRFRPTEPNPELATDVLFVGNSRKQRRPIVDAAIEAGLPLSIYGSDWHGLVPDEYIKGEYFPNEKLTELYASATVVLNDHWPDMAAKGFISNRVFDALASGAALVTDQELPEEWGDRVLVHVFDGSVELEKVIADAVAEPRERRLSLAQRVAERHSFDERARVFTDVASSERR